MNTNAARDFPLNGSKETGADGEARNADPEPPYRWPSTATIMKIARIVVLSYLGIVAVLYSLQTRLIFPGASTQGQAEADVHPHRGTELVKLKTSQGDTIVALYGESILSNGRPDPQAADRPTMIFFYGNAMCLKYAAVQLEEFRRLGVECSDS